MKILIDGYNLLHQLKFKTKNFSDKRERLIYLLEEFKKINNVDITVIFDGKNQESQIRGFENKNGVKIIYSASGETADDVIIDILKKIKEKPKNYAVVTSDNKIINFAYENSIRIITSENFADYLI